MFHHLSTIGHPLHGANRCNMTEIKIDCTLEPFDTFGMDNDMTLLPCKTMLMKMRAKKLSSIIVPDGQA